MVTTNGDGKGGDCGRVVIKDRGNLSAELQTASYLKTIVIINVTINVTMPA